MSFENINSVRKEYERKYEELEKKLSGELPSSDRLTLENELEKVDETLDVIDDLLDALNDKDVDDVKNLEEELKGRLI